MCDTNVILNHNTRQERTKTKLPSCKHPFRKKCPGFNTSYSLLTKPSKVRVTENNVNKHETKKFQKFTRSANLKAATNESQLTLQYTNK